MEKLCIYYGPLTRPCRCDHGFRSWSFLLIWLSLTYTSNHHFLLFSLCNVWCIICILYDLQNDETKRGRKEQCWFVIMSYFSRVYALHHYLWDMHINVYLYADCYADLFLQSSFATLASDERDIYYLDLISSQMWWQRVALCFSLNGRSSDRRLYFCYCTSPSCLCDV